MDANYDYFLDFTQTLDEQAEYNAWIDNQEQLSQELPEDYRY